jgi:hypothetical protein
LCDLWWKLFQMKRCRHSVRRGFIIHRSSLSSPTL